MNAMVRLPLQGEYLGPDESILVWAAMHPLKTTREPVIVPAGSSVEEIVKLCSEKCGVPRLASAAFVTVDGEPVPREWWPRVRVRSGANVVVRAVPGKGMGSILKSILSIALIAVAGFIVGPAVLGLTGMAASLVSAGIVLGGNLLLNMLFPPASSKSDKSDPVYSIASRQNSSSRWGPIPVLLGRHRIAGKYAASPFTEIVGNDQYLHLLVVWGLGPMSVDDIKIGDTPISEYQDVEIQTFEGYPTDAKQTIYPSSVVQEDFQIEPEFDKPVTRVGADESIAVSLDFMAPQGIGAVDAKSGDLKTHLVDLHIIIKDDVTKAVVYDQYYQLKAKTRDPLRKSLRVDLPKGRYSVQVIRASKDSTGDNRMEQVIWSAMRSYRNEPAIMYGKPLAMTALRIRATKQLNGTISDLTAICMSKAKSYVDGVWLDNRHTSTPPDLFRLVLQGPGNSRPVSDQRIDLPALGAWSEMCEVKGWKFDMYRDFPSSIPETLQDICAAGRAVPIFRDGKWSVAMEDDLASVVQVFTPRNVRDFSKSIVHNTLPHALRVKFVNKDKDWIEDEELVYDDGYDRFNATLFETVEFPGVTDPANVFKHARYLQASAKLRRSVYRFVTDAEHLICTRGDRVRASHYVLRNKAVSARVTAVSGQTVTFDDELTMATGTSYAMDVRRSSGAVVTLPVGAKNGTFSTVTVTGSPPAVGDLIVIGTATLITGDYKILTITPGDDFSAEIEMVDDAPGIQSADSGPIDGGTGTVGNPPEIASYRPRGLRLTSFMENTPTGNIFRVRLTWSMVPPPGMTIQSFLIVASAEDGTERRDAVGADQYFVDYTDLSDGVWTFRVFAYFQGDKISNASDPLTTALNIPWDELGVGLGNIMPDIQYVLQYGNESIAYFNDLLEQVAANSAAAALLVGERAQSNQAKIIEETVIREEENFVMAERVEGVRSDLVGQLAGQAAVVESLSSEVERVGNDITSEAERIDLVIATVEDIDDDVKGQATGLSTLTSTVSQLGTSFTIQGQRIDSVQSTLSGLDGEVEDLDGDIRAQATAVSNLNTKVTQQGNTITAQGTTLTGVKAMAEGATAEGLTRTEVIAGGSGVSARFVQMLRVSTGGTYRQGAFYMDISSGGVVTAGFDVQRFFITDGTSKALPMRFENGTLFANGLYVTMANVTGELNANRIVANSIAARELLIDGIPASRLGYGSHTAVAGSAGSGGLTQNGQILLATVNINLSDTGTIIAIPSGTATFAGGDPGSGGSARFKVDIDGIEGSIRGGLAGNHTVQLYGVYSGSTDNSGTARFNATLFVIGSKKT